MAKENASKGFRVILPWSGIPKARPRFNSHSRRAYMPKEYMEWKKQIVEFLSLSPNVTALQGPLSMVIYFRKTEVEVIISEGAPQRFGKADLDNLCGGIMDAFENAGVFKDDIQISRLLAEIVK